ncbi:MAG: ABC transporter substrate-binding protein [Gemmatimonadota bacterium]
MKHAIGAVLMAVATTAVAIPASASEIRVGFTLDAVTLDPANHRKRETETIIRNMYDGILTRNAKMEVVPELAESWKQINATTYEFKLRKGVKFHNGETMTADDVKFTFDRLTKEGAMGGQTSPRKSLLGPLKEVLVVDPLTVRFVLSEPWPILPAMLPFQEVVSRKFVEANGSEALATKEDGTGPFRLVEWRKGDAVIMERFNDYYGGATAIPPVGKACVDRVIFKVIPENASRVAALLAGDVDIINELPPHTVKQVESNPNTRVMSVRGTRSVFIAMNLQVPPLNDIRVRQALAHAIDKKLLIDRILGGHATPINGILSPDAFAFDPSLPAVKYDPALSRKLLAEAGFKDGLDLTLDTEGAHKETAEAIAAVAGKGGFRIRVVVGEGSQLQAKWRKKDEPKAGEMFFTSWGNGSLDPYDIFDPTHMTGGRGNSSFYSNPVLDKLLTDAAVEPDRVKRATLYKQAQEILAKDLPYVYLWVPADLYGVSKRLTGWQPSADSRINLHDACVK